MPSPSSPSSSRLPLTLIAAVSPTNGLGKSGGLPWSLKGEMAYFRRASSYVPEDARGRARNAVIMGRNTWESIPAKFRPLKNRVNVVVSRSAGADREAELGTSSSADAHLVSSLDAALHLLSSPSQNIHRAFLIGGSQLYTQALEDANLVTSLLITRILTPDFDCDVFLPEFRTEGQVKEDAELAKMARGEGDGEDSKISNGSPPPPPSSSPLPTLTWNKRPHSALAALLGGGDNVQEGIVTEGDVKYEFQLWERAGRE